MHFLTNLETRYRPLAVGAGFALIAVMGILDYVTGYELGFSLFYLVPICLIGWIAGRPLGIVAALISAAVWLSVDVAAGQQYSHPVIYLWNTLIRLGFFVVVTYLLTALRNALEHERELARTDFLTGALNSRSFYDLLKMEIDRCRRYHHPFSIVYVDLDNFKTVNDQLGHSAGDEVLRVVVGHARKYLRKTDTLTRLGGDEFALLLPETNQLSAQAAVAKLQRGLLTEMEEGKWPITFSIGVMTCNAAPPTALEIVRMADQLMYTAKREGKNAVQYASYPADDPARLPV